MQSPLYFNGQISRDTLCFSDWQKNGIQIVGDLVDNNGKINSYELIRDKFGIKSNIFNYYRIIGLLKAFIKNYKKEIISPYRGHIC